MSVAELKTQISSLSDAERRELINWLNEAESAAWDAEIERDCLPGGPGERLLQRVNAEIDELLASDQPIPTLQEEMRRRLSS
ncbi:hypothetical protein F183_A11470 [Bryobacterales bacterium F-183]|nr:hypothetical protein F183_A11470 [Bryobacterales bacterium F-183]